MLVVKRHRLLRGVLGRAHQPKGGTQHLYGSGVPPDAGRPSIDRLSGGVRWEGSGFGEDSHVQLWWRLFTGAQGSKASVMSGNQNSTCHAPSRAARAGRWPVFEPYDAPARLRPVLSRSGHHISSVKARHLKELRQGVGLDFGLKGQRL